MRYGIVVFPGSNCERELYRGIRASLGENVDYLWHEDRQISRSYDCIILPGGFSYGDYLRAGVLASRSPILKEVVRLAHQGNLVLGICNGFQILLETGLLPGALLWNRSLHYLCQFAHIRTENSHTPFTHRLKKHEVLKIPIAHLEGRYYCDEKAYERLEENEQILFRYSDETGIVSETNNPNGSLGSIAGISNSKKNVMGLMPHPERALESLLGSEDGKKIFLSISSSVKSSVENI